MAKSEISGTASDMWTHVEPDPRGGQRFEISLSGSPFHYVFRMVEREGELICAGVAVEQPDGEETLEVTGPVTRELTDRLEGLVELAANSVRAYRVTVTPAGERDEAARLNVGVRTRRTLSDEFLRDVVARHDEYRAQGLPPTQTLARAERVSDGTVKHWLRKAREAGIETS